MVVAILASSSVLQLLGMLLCPISRELYNIQQIRSGMQDTYSQFSKLIITEQWALMAVWLSDIIAVFAGAIRISQIVCAAACIAETLVRKTLQ